MVLIAFIQFNEIAAPTPYPYYEIPVQFRVLLGIKESVTVQGVELQLVAAQAHVITDEHCQFLHRLVVAEDALVQFDGEGAAVDGVFQVLLGEGPHHRNRSLLAQEHAGREVGGDYLSGAAAVRGCRKILGVEDIIHGRTGACTPDAATLVPLAPEAFCKGLQEGRAD